jgi:hypothetical protein
MNVRSDDIWADFRRRDDFRHALSFTTYPRIGDFFVRLPTRTLPAESLVLANLVFSERFIVFKGVTGNAASLKRQILSDKNSNANAHRSSQ